MQFKTDKQILGNALTMLNPFLEKKDNSIAISNVYLEVNNTTLILNATDYNFGLKLEIPFVQDSVDGVCLVNGTDFLNIVKRLKNGEVHVIYENDEVLIKQGRSNLRLDSMPAKEYPSLDIRNFENMKELEFDTKVLYDGIKKSLFSIDTNNPKIELQCLLLDFNESLKAVSTDTRSLVIYDTNVKSLDKTQLLIPKISIVEIQKIIVNECKIYFDDVHLVIESENLRFFTKLINGKFPQYERIIPQSFEHDFLIPKNEFVEAVKMVTALDLFIDITFSENQIHIQTVGDKKPSETTIQYELKCDNQVKVRLNSTILLNAISNIEKEVFNFKMNNPHFPVSVASDNYNVIIMPVIDNTNE